MKYYTLYFGQAYGEGDYGNGNYSCTTQQQASGACTSSSTSSGGLVNTGVAVAGFVTLACLIIFVSILVHVLRRKPTAKNSQPGAQVEAAHTDEPDDDQKA